MNIAGVDYESVKDGIGVRTVIYTSGCSHNCPMCHNSVTHDSNYGISFTEEVQEVIRKEIKRRPFISGLTWSGGDPLHENNLKDVIEFSNKFRVSFPGKTIWLYTGYTWEEIFYDRDQYTPNSFYKDKLSNLHAKRKRRNIVQNVDILVDGRYIDSQRDITLEWRGSKNQRVIDVKKSLERGQIILWCN